MDWRSGSAWMYTKKGVSPSSLGAEDAVLCARLLLSWSSCFHAATLQAVVANYEVPFTNPVR
eukprot:2137833-Amphidinium_carterae.2